ncbi:cation:proton antiporter [Leuconostoc miyukkimchii]|uniref:cation:proton antiporter n=1 Tax=Leuconostoc miyukkimchii TaxID=910540 RepID=UPI001C7D90D7|nr:sodium:proton antiporter [Leuconostoc miyukkimchii]
MTILYSLSLLLIGVIGTNIIQQFIPKIPEAFILIFVGVCLSLTPIFKNFELEPEFFMLMVIAPLMFLDGQKQSFQKIKKRFNIILSLSVILAIASAAAVGVLANYIEVSWTLPLAIALAAIVVPTDAVAVKSFTSGTDMPDGVDEALELESLFNDATGLVMLDLALSVLEKGSFSIFNGLQHFVFVATGGVIIGIVSGFLLVWLRTMLNFRASDPETTIIPLSLLTPFAVYLLAEYFGTSGILAVVATGIVHNWESSKLRLTSTRVQLTQSTVWGTIANILNSIVFLILGVSLPAVWHEIARIGFSLSAQLLVLSCLIYLTMFVVRFLWARNADTRDTITFFGDKSDKNHIFNARLFAISGVHGTVTLAMVFSLPNRIGGQIFPYREELIIVATMVILISMLVSAISLPIMLPAKANNFTAETLDAVRDQMVDYATLEALETVKDHNIRETLTDQLQSQKGFSKTINQRDKVTKNYQELFEQTTQFILNYLQTEHVNSSYDAKTVNIYQKIINRVLKPVQTRNPINLFKQTNQRLKNKYKRTKWYFHHRKEIRNKGVLFQKNIQTKYTDTQQQWLDTKNALLKLNDEVIIVVHTYLNDLLRQRLEKHATDNQHIVYVRRELDRYFSAIKRDYKKDAPAIDSALYMKAFQSEYNFIQQELTNSHISDSIANILYNEINQAQTLQLQQLRQVQSLND